MEPFYGVGVCCLSPSSRNQMIEGLINDFKEWKRIVEEVAEHVMLDSLGFIKIWHAELSTTTLPIIYPPAPLVTLFHSCP